MAEKERMTKRERRAQARAERDSRAARERQERRRNALRKGLISVVAVLAVAALVYQAFFAGEEGIDEAILIRSEEVEEAYDAAGCETLVERDPLPESAHVDRAAVTGDALYPDVRPTHSGPHAPETVQPLTRGSETQLDEVSLTHNLEHGAVVAWYDPDRVDDGTPEAMSDWAARLNESGFIQRASAAIFVSPYEEPGIGSGKAVALRAWGTAVDCDRWDEDVANGFVARHYGTRGVGPERDFAPYPDDVLDFADEDPSGRDDGDGGTGDDPDAGDAG